MYKKIFLLADDDSDDKELFFEALKSIDNTIVCHITSDGSEALEKLRSLPEKPHVIFLDINMPVLNGWQCFEELKKDQKYEKIPVVIISTSSHQRELDHAKELGALCYVTKPNEFNELCKVLQIFVEGLNKGFAGLKHLIESANSRYISRFDTKKMV